MLRNGTPRQVGPLKTVTGELSEDAPAVLEGLIARLPAPLRCLRQEGATGLQPNLCGEHLPGCQGARGSRHSGKVDAVPAGQQEGGGGMETAQTKSLGG